MSIDYSILAQNLRLVATRQPDAAEYFIALLFRQRPAAERLFPPQISPAHLAATFESVLANPLGDVPIAKVFRMIGERHRSQGATEEVYRAAADALMSILILVSGDAWTPSLHSLWRSACVQFIAWMTAGLGTPAEADTPTGSATDAEFAEPPASESPYLLVLAGPGQGEVIPLGRTVTIGSGDEVDLHIPDDAVSREHARIVRGSLALHLTDLKSGSGTRLNDLPVSRPTVLSDGDRIRLGTTTLLLFTYHQGLEQHFRRGLFHRAAHDRLTQVYTREYFSEHLTAEVAFARRHNAPLSVLLLQPCSLETDGSFSRRDYSLRTVARRIKSVLRTEDLLARYDEDRLAILCRDLHDQQALLLAKRLRQLVAIPPHVVGARAASPAARIETVSIGIGSLIHSRTGDFRDSFLFSAEIALYRAIHLGPGRIVVAGEIDPS